MKNFIEWCVEKGLSLEANHTEPVRKGKKVADPNKYSGKARKTTDDLSNDYKSFWADNGTVDPFNVKGGKHGKASADVAK